MGAVVAGLLLCVLHPETSFAASPVAISGELNDALIQYRAEPKRGSSKTFSAVDSYTSRLAFKGSEDLGDGLFVDFLLGTGFRADDGRASFCNRECWVRIRGSLGSLKLGRTLPIYDDISTVWYFIDSPGVHNPLALWANCGNNAGWKEGCFDNYQPDSVRYDSPKLRGFSASASFSNPLPDVTGDARPRVMVAGGEYASGPFYIGLARQVHHGVRDAGLEDVATTVSASVKSWVTVAVGYERLRYQINTGGTLGREYLGMMISYALGRQTVWGNYGVATRGRGNAAEGSAVNAVQNLERSGAAMWSLGYQYKFSPGFQVYAFYNRIDNQDNGIYSFDSRLTSLSGKGGRQSALAAGLQKRF